MDVVFGVGALLMVSAEWAALGWLAGVAWPRTWGSHIGRTWALRILVGAALVACAQLVLSATGVGFGALSPAGATLGLGFGALSPAGAALGLGFGASSAGTALGRVAPMVLTLALAALAAVGLRRAGAEPRSVRTDPASADAPIRDAGSDRPGGEHPGGDRPGGDHPGGEHPGWERLGWAVMAVLLLAALVRALATPELGWDAYSHWGLRAAAYAQAGTVVNAGSEHDYYPPLVPLLEAWFDLHLGRVSLDFSKSIWAVIGGAFTVCLAAQLHGAMRARWLAPWLAIAIVGITPELLDGFFTGQADLPLAAFLTLASLAGWQWLRHPTPGGLIQVGLFAAAAALCKLEAGPRLAVVALAFGADAVLSRKTDLIRPIATLAIAITLPLVIWTAVANAASISPNSEHVGAFQAGAAPRVASALAAVFGGIRTGGGLVVTVLAWLLAGTAVVRSDIRVLTLVGIGQIAATLIAFFIGSTDPVVQVQTSATRLVGQILPLVLVAAILGIDASVGWPGAETYNRREPG